MKGLVLKDLYSVRLQIFLSVLTMILPNIAFTFLIGEEGVGLGEAETVFMVFFFGSLNYINICLFSSFMLNTLDSDVNCGWSRIVRTFPVSGNTMVMAKFAATGLVLAILTGISLIFNIVGSFVNSLPLEPLIAIPVCIGFLQAAVLFPIFPFAMAHGTKCTSALYIVVEILMVSLAAFGIINIMKLENWGIILRCVFYAGSVILAAVSAVISAASGKKAVSAALK